MIKIIRRFKYPLLAVIGLILAFLLLRQFGPLKPTPPPIEEVSVVSEDESLISASGKVQAKNMANLTFQTGGQLVWIGVKEGDSVQKWQGIASLDRRELEKRLSRYMNLYLTNRWDFEQLQDDYKDEKEKALITDAIKRILEKAQFSLNNAVIDVELADLSLKWALLSTPISGIVTKVEPSHPGVNVTPLTANFTVVDPSSVYFATNVDEADIAKVKIGQKVKILLDAYEGEEFEGEVKNIAFVAQPTAGGGTAFPVEISLPENSDLRFKIGMNGDAEIALK